MNGWSAHIVMSGNNSDVIPAKAGIQRSMSAGQESYDARMRFWIPVFAGITCFFVFFLSVFLSPTARAQESAAQALYGVQEILVRPVHFDDPAAAKSCRLVGSDVDELIMKELKDNGLPVVAEKDARPSLTDVPRILLVPQIVPFNSQGMDCVTWTALSAESRNHLRVLPIQIPRVVNVIYWRYGEMVASAVSVHGEHVSASLHNMIRQFGQRYTQAQPPTVGRPTAPAPR